MQSKRTVHKLHVAYDDLQSLIHKVDQIIESNPDAGLSYSSFSLDYEDEPYEDYRNTVLEYSLPETPAERLERENKERTQKERQEEWDRRQFEALKKKYGNET